MYRHIVFTTKYARHTIHEKSPILLTIEEKKIVQEIIHEKEVLGYTIFAYSIMDDHVHLLIYITANNTSKIIQHIKGKSSYQINRYRKEKIPLHYRLQQHRRDSIRAVGYSDTGIRDYTHLLHTIDYIANNHIKHNQDAVTFTANIQKFRGPATP